MYSIAFRLTAEERDRRNQIRIRRNLRDCSNPLELPQALFKQHYRVNKPAFKYLLDILMNSVPPPKKAFGIPCIVKLTACLRFFAEGGYQKGVARDSEVGLAQSSFSEVLAEVLLIFEREICPKWITVNTEVQQKREVALSFFEKHRIPGVVGCIDGTHVRIVGPSINKHLYYNRKGFFSLNVMLVCDHELKIRYVDATHPGGCHDSMIWNVSGLRKSMEQDYLHGVNNFWLLGDAGYSLEPWLLTPYRSTEEDSNERKFNNAHKSSRNIIERAIGNVKGQWRCLLSAQLHYSPEKAVKIVNVCCALYNKCKHFRVDSFSEDLTLENSDDDPDELSPLPQSRYMTVAQRIRTDIGNSL